MVMYLDGKDSELVQSEDFKAAQASHYGVSYDSPSSVLPPELVSIIFMFARQNKSVPHKLPFEVIISHVCRYWRVIALITPGLWNRINVYSTRSVDRFNHYLERSSNQPLDVFIDIYQADKRITNTENPVYMYAYHPILNGIFFHMHRIRQLSLECHHQRTAVFWQDMFKDELAAPILTSFTVQHGTILTGHSPAFGGLASIFEGGLPRLTYLETDTPNIFPPPQQLGQLSTLYLHGLDPRVPLDQDDFMAMFNSLPSLVNLSLQSSVGYATWTPSPTPRFTLNKLKSLRVLDGAALAIRVLLAVSAPNLESLWLQCSFDNFPTYLFGAGQMRFKNHPKFPQLKYLTLVMDDFSTSPEFAKIFPTITHLHYFYPNFRRAKELVEAVGPQGWSCLQTLVFSAFREKDAVHLNAAITSLLSQGLHNNQLRTILIDKDHMRWLNYVMPLEKPLPRPVKLDLLSANNYHEYWWNIFEERNHRL